MGGYIIVPFFAYSKYNNEGNLSDEDKIGLRFVCLSVDTSSVMKSDQFYISLDDSTTDLSLVGETPEEALQLKEEAYRRWISELPDGPFRSAVEKSELERAAAVQG